MKITKLINRFLFMLSILILTLSACKKEELANQYKDPRDGTVYKTVKIGSQTWMAENLRYLPYMIKWRQYSQTMPYYCVAGYDEDQVSEAKNTFNYSTYGVAYNWVAAQSACPPGWHIPSIAEWNQLINYCGGDSIAGGNLKAKGTQLWQKPNTGGVDAFGFNALPGGTGLPGHTGAIGFNISFWNSKIDTSNSFQIGIALLHDYSAAFSDRSTEEGCRYIRCIKD